MQFQKRKKNQECFTQKKKSLCFSFKLRYQQNKDNLAIYSVLTELNSDGPLPWFATSLYFIFNFTTSSASLNHWKPQELFSTVTVKDRNQAMYLHILFNQNASDFKGLQICCIIISIIPLPCLHSHSKAIKPHYFDLIQRYLCIYDTFISTNTE